MTQINLTRQKSGEQTLPVRNETTPLLPLSQASLSEDPASGAQKSAAGDNSRREEDGDAESSVMNPEPPVTTAPSVAAGEIPQEEQAATAGSDESQDRSPVSVANLTENVVKFYRDSEAPESLPANGKTTGRMPVATASPDGGVRMLVPPEGNRDYLTAGQVEKLLHAAYMRGRNEAVAAKIEADTSIRTLPQHGDVLFSTRPSVWEPAQ